MAQHIGRGSCGGSCGSPRGNESNQRLSDCLSCCLCISLSAVFFTSLWPLCPRLRTLQVAAVCHGLASFSRHPLFDAAAPTSYLPPGAGRALTVVVAHAFVGMSLGLCAWKMVVARAGEREGPLLITCTLLKAGRYISMIGWSLLILCLCAPPLR